MGYRFSFRACVSVYPVSRLFCVTQLVSLCVTYWVSRLCDKFSFSVCVTHLVFVRVMFFSSCYIFSSCVYYVFSFRTRVACSVFALVFQSSFCPLVSCLYYALFFRVYIIFLCLACVQFSCRVWIELEIGYPSGFPRPGPYSEGPLGRARRSGSHYDQPRAPPWRCFTYRRLGRLARNCPSTVIPDIAKVIYYLVCISYLSCIWSSPCLIFFFLH